MDILETQNSLEKPIKGELKSIDVPDVGTVEYSEHFFELSSATRRRLDVEDLEGFKVKKVLSLPPALETQFKGIEETLKTQHGVLRLNQTKGDPEKVLEVVKSMAAFSTKFYEDVLIKSRDSFDQLLRIEYELTEGRTPSWGTVQHAMGGPEFGISGYFSETTHKIGSWTRERFLFSPYRSNQYGSFDVAGGQLEHIGSGSLNPRHSWPTDEYLRKRNLTEQKQGTHRSEGKILDTTGSDITAAVKEHLADPPVREDRMFAAEPFRYDLQRQPFIFSFGNKNKLFVDYLMRLREFDDPIVKEALSDHITHNETPKEERARVMTFMASIPREQRFLSEFETRLSSDELSWRQFLLGPATTGDVIERLLKREPMCFEGVEDDIKIPIFQGGPFGTFRLGCMAEAIINIPDKTVILPMTK